jgi:hypothetical protein
MKRLLYGLLILAGTGWAQAPAELESARQAFQLRIQGLQNQFKVREAAILKQYGIFLAKLTARYRASGANPEATQQARVELERFNTQATLSQEHFQKQPPNLSAIQARVLHAINEMHQFSKDQFIDSQRAYMEKLDELLAEYADTGATTSHAAVKAEMLRIRPDLKWTDADAHRPSGGGEPEGKEWVHISFDILSSDHFANEAQPASPARNLYAKPDPKGRKNGSCYMPKDSQSHVVLEPFALGSPFTVSCWVKFESVERPQKLWSFGDGDDREVIELTIAAKGLMFSYNHKSVRKFIRKTGSYETGRWYHFAVTLDEEGRASVYQDGVLLDAKPGNEIDPVKRDHMFIGRSSFQDIFLAGWVDDFVVMKDALSAERIKQLYDSY